MIMFYQEVDIGWMKSRLSLWLSSCYHFIGRSSIYKLGFVWHPDTFLVVRETLFFGTPNPGLPTALALHLSCTILCSTAFCRLSNDSQRRITQRTDDVDGAAYRLHGQKLAGIVFNRESNNVGVTASAAAAGNRFHSGMVRATNDPWSCAVTATMARNLK